MESPAHMATTMFTDNAFGDDMFGNHSLFRPERDAEEAFNGWNAHPTVAPIIAEHWKTFPPAHPFFHYIYGVLNAFFFFISCTGNGVVIYVFLTTKALKTPSNVFIVCLAICDFLMMVKTPVVIYQSFKLGPVLDVFWCKFYGVIGTVSCASTTWNNAFISFDRYRTISQPFDGKLTMTQVMIMAVGTYLIIIPYASLPALEIWGLYSPEGYLTSCAIDAYKGNLFTNAYIHCCFTFMYTLPALAIVYFYSKVFGHVRAHEKAMKEQARKMNVKSLRSVGTKEDQEKSAEIRVAKVGMTTFFLHMISWTPYVYILYHGVLDKAADITPFAAMIPALTCKTVACFDPFMYAVNHPKYRISLAKKLPWLCVKENEIKGDNVSTATGATPEATEEKA